MEYPRRVLTSILKNHRPFTISDHFSQSPVDHSEREKYGVSFLIYEKERFGFLCNIHDVEPKELVLEILSGLQRSHYKLANASFGILPRICWNFKLHS
jgi:hypothetical protein